MPRHSHVFCSFLALVLRKELQARCEDLDIKPEWGDVLRDLDRLQSARIEAAGAEWTLRTKATGTAPDIMRAVRVALPPRALPSGRSPPAGEIPAPEKPKRRGRPRHGATRP